MLMKHWILADVR